MKIKCLAITALLVFSAMNLSACATREDTTQPVCMNNACGGVYYMGCRSGCCGAYGGQNCQCTDPDCRGNPCLSYGRCCEAFGNDGA